MEILSFSDLKTIRSQERAISHKSMNACEIWDDMIPDLPDMDLNEIKTLKINQLNFLCNTAILGVFHSNSLDRQYIFDSEAQANFNQQLSLLLLDTSNQDLIPWKSEDQGVSSLTRDEFIELCKESSAHKKYYMNKYWELKLQVEEAKTLNEVESISF